MASLFENVVGNVLHIQDFHSPIPFSTSSDALFSSLFVKFKCTVPMEVFDAMLALFRHSDFRCDAVTIQKAEDMLDRISAQRQQIAKRRNLKRASQQIAATSQTMCHPQATNLIPALLAEYIGLQRLPSLRVTNYDFFNHTENELKSMSLVHRSWTEASQRYLRQHIFITSPTDLRAVMQSTTVGPWVRELRFCDNRGYSNPLTTLDETPRLLAGVLQRCPNLTCLDLRGYKTGLSIEISHDVLDQLACLVYLEHLLLRPSPGISYLEFGKLATVLPNLHSLKSLNLRHWRVDRVMPLSSPKRQDVISPDAPIPPTSLEALTLVDVDVVTSGIFSWFLYPRSGIRKLELRTDDFMFDQFGQDLGDDRFSIMDATTAHITKLRLVNCQSTDCLNFVLRFFPSLQLLSLHPNFYADVPLGSFVLPYGTISSFHYHYVREQNTDQDPLALAMLKAYPNIRCFLITYAICCSYADWEDQEPTLLFKNSIEYAERNNVEFQVRQAELEDLPHIYDL